MKISFKTVLMRMFVHGRVCTVIILLSFDLLVAHKFRKKEYSAITCFTMSMLNLKGLCHRDFGDFWS